MIDYNAVIKIKYPEARGPLEPGQNYEISAVIDATGQHFFTGAGALHLRSPAIQRATVDPP